MAKQSLDVDKRRRVSPAVLAHIQREEEQEASLFCGEMFPARSKNSKRRPAAKEVFNTNSVSQTQREIRKAQEITPTKPDSNDPAVLHRHIDLLSALTSKQAEVSIFC